MTDIDVTALRARAVDQAAQVDKQSTVAVDVTGVWLGSRYHPVTDPAVVLALLNELEALRAAVRTHREPTPQQWDAYASCVREMPDPYRDEALIADALGRPDGVPHIPPSLKRTMARNSEEQP